MQNGRYGKCIRGWGKENPPARVARRAGVRYAVGLQVMLAHYDYHAFRVDGVLDAVGGVLKSPTLWLDDVVEP